MSNPREDWIGALREHIWLWTRRAAPTPRSRIGILGAGCRRGAVTNAQFLNAVALGQITPVPVVQTIAVIGCAAAGLGGGLLAAAIAIGPLFAFVLIGGPRFDRLNANTNANAAQFRRSSTAQGRRCCTHTCFLSRRPMIVVARSFGARGTATTYSNRTDSRWLRGPENDH
jgi:hypothetical protein